MRDAGDDLPELVLLHDVVRRLGQLADNISVTDRTVREPVPDWLAERLIYTAGLPSEKVAAFDLQEAVEVWAEYRSGLR